MDDESTVINNATGPEPQHVPDWPAYSTSRHRGGYVCWAKQDGTLVSSSMGAPSEERAAKWLGAWILRDTQWGRISGVEETLFRFQKEPSVN